MGGHDHLHGQLDQSERVGLVDEVLVRTLCRLPSDLLSVLEVLLRPGLGQQELHRSQQTSISPVRLH